MRSSLAYALIFVFSALLVSSLLTRMRSSSGSATTGSAATAFYTARVSLLLKLYLAILIAFELVALHRLGSGEPLHVVCDFLVGKKSAAFTALWSSYLQLLTAARIAALLAPPLQSQAWVACALTHVVEAWYVVPLAFREGALPASLRELNLGRHGAAAFIVFMVAVNAYLFTCVAAVAVCQVPAEAPGSAVASASARSRAAGAEEKKGE